jgi:hypothetical protein
MAKVSARARKGRVQIIGDTGRKEIVMSPHPWIRTATMPEHCREIETKSLFGPLAGRLADQLRALDVSRGQIDRLRGTRLPMFDGLVLLEAQLQTPKGPALASYLWLHGKLEPLDRQIEFLSLPMLVKIAETGMPPVGETIAFARVFCASLTTENWLFWPCLSEADVEGLYDIEPEQRQELGQVSFATEPVGDDADGTFEMTLAYGPQLFRSLLKPLRNGRFEMIEDTPIRDLPAPRLMRGPNGWLYPRRALEDG